MEELTKDWLCGIRTRRIKDNYKMSDIAAGRTELPATAMNRMKKEQALGKRSGL